MFVLNRLWITFWIIIGKVSLSKICSELGESNLYERMQEIRSLSCVHLHDFPKSWDYLNEIEEDKV